MLGASLPCLHELLSCHYPLVDTTQALLFLRTGDRFAVCMFAQTPKILVGLSEVSSATKVSSRSPRASPLDATVSCL